MLQNFLKKVVALSLISTCTLVGGLVMPFRVRSSPAGYPITPPITAEELGASIDFPTHILDGVHKQRSATITVAAYNASQSSIKGSDYVCDGASDQVEINAAISALGSRGGRVVLSEGTYIVDGTIILPSNVTLCGQGASTVIRVKDNYNQSLDVIRNSDSSAGNSYISINDLVIDGNKSANSTGTYTGIKLTRVTDSIISGLLVRNFKDIGMYIDECRTSVFWGNILQGNYYGILLAYISSGDIIAGNILRYNARGIHLDGVEDCVLLSNICEENSEHGISINMSDRCSVFNNICRYNGAHGLNIEGCNENIIIGNFCIGNSTSSDVTYDNIIVQGGGLRNLVQNNVCRIGPLATRPRYGIRIEYSYYTLVTGNDCYDGGANGGISDSGSSTVFGFGNRNKDGTWSTTPN